MNPAYRYERDEPPELTGYRVAQTAQVVVTDLAQGGRAVTAVIDAGGNAVRVSNIRLEVSDPGQTLGEVMTLVEVVPASGYRDQLLAQRATLDTAYLAGPIRAGEQELAVTVEVVWSLV